VKTTTTKINLELTRIEAELIRDAADMAIDSGGFEEIGLNPELRDLSDSLSEELALGKSGIPASTILIVDLRLRTLAAAVLMGLQIQADWDVSDHLEELAAHPFTDLERAALTELITQFEAVIS
jgi:hypothetical protein